MEFNVFDASTCFGFTNGTIYSIRIYNKVFEKFIEKKESLRTINDKYPINWKIIQAITNLLGLFEPITKKVEGDTYVTISTVIPYFQSLLVHLKDYQKNVGVVCGASQSAEKKLLQYKSCLHSGYEIATILDPRFKLEALIESQWTNNPVFIKDT